MLFCDPPCDSPSGGEGEFRLADSVLQKRSLAEIVPEIDRELTQNKGAPLRAGYLHMLSPGVAARVKELTNEIDYYQVGILLGRMQSGDQLAGTILVLKYHNIILRPLRQLDTNTRIVQPGRRRQRRGFTLDDFKLMGLDQNDLVQEAELLLYKLLCEYRPKGSMFLGYYLKRFFPARFATYVRKTLTYVEGGKRKAKVRASAYRKPDDRLAQPILPALTGAEPVHDFVDYMSKAGNARATLRRHVEHYLPGRIRTRAPVQEVVTVILQQNWTLEPVVWRRQGPLPVPQSLKPERGVVQLYVPRDAYLDEYLRSKDAHRYLHQLKRGQLGHTQIRVFQLAYGPQRLTDEEIAECLGVSRAAVQKARSRAVDHVLEKAVQAYLRDVQTDLLDS